MWDLVSWPGIQPCVDPFFSQHLYDPSFDPYWIDHFSPLSCTPVLLSCSFIWDMFLCCLLLPNALWLFVCVCKLFIVPSVGDVLVGGPGAHHPLEANLCDLGVLACFSPLLSRFLVYPFESMIIMCWFWFLWINLTWSLLSFWDVYVSHQN